jgi:hypothetical protein
MFVVFRHVKQNDCLAAHITLLGDMIRRTPCNDRVTLVAELTAGVEAERTRIREREWAEIPRTPFITPASALYAILYDLLSAFPSELVRLVCGYYTLAELPSRFVKYVPRGEVSVP